MLYRISKERLLTILQDFPEIAERMKKAAKSRVRRLDNFLDPMKKPLSSEDEADAEDKGTELFDADVDKVAREKYKEYKEERRQHYRGAPAAAVNSAGGRKTGLYSSIKRRANQVRHKNGTVLPLAHQGST